MKKQPFATLSFSKTQIYIRLFYERISLHLHIRSLIIVGILAALAIIIAFALLFVGTYPITVNEAFAAFIGKADYMIEVVMIEWRLPRIALALLFGAALAISGAIFQSLTHNPLGSPDIMGFSAGSYTGALIVIIIFSGGYYQIALGSLISGLITVFVVYLLAYRGGLKSFRLIIVGIAVAAMLSAFNSWLILKADMQVAMYASLWGAGSLNGLGLDQLIPVVLCLIIIIPFILRLSPYMHQLEMGDELAISTGVSVNKVRFLLLFFGIALVAMVTAAAGPISFIALVAPQIAKRLSKSAGIPLIPSAFVGALLLLVADAMAQYAFKIQLPLGVMTAIVGGFYFIWLLIKEARK